jgi:hypothetical protein
LYLIWGLCLSDLLVAGWNQSYLDVSAVTSDPWYPGYNTPTVAPEPSVEWVVGASHSMVVRIGSHMVLWALLLDSVVRLQS